MADRLFNVLFLCTHNSARSVMAEALLNVLGRERFRAYSAGSMPSGRANPFAIEMAKTIGYETGHVRSKSWNEFAVTGAPKMDIVITVCDNAANELCPIWPTQDGQAPAVAHWGFPDPSTTVGSADDKRKAFQEVFQAIRQRIELLVTMPLKHMEREVLANELQRIHAR